MNESTSSTQNQPVNTLTANERKRLQQAEMLLNISHQVASSQSLDDMLETLVQLTTHELNADRGTIFLNDSEAGELYSRFAMGNRRRSIRILNTEGIAGAVFTSGKGLLIHDTYADERFNKEVDQQTGYETRNLICVPIKTINGDIVGVSQVLNKIQGQFEQDDASMLEAMSMQAAVALQNTQVIDKMKQSRQQELEFLDIVADITSEIDLGVLLKKVMSEATRMLNAERSTLFLNDEKTNELFSKLGAGIEAKEIRFPNHLGIAGAVFTTSKTINIPYAYADLRFNPAFDKQTGFFTRSILCVPLENKKGKMIGVTQMLNKRGGAFTQEDESRLKAFTAQVAISLENAKLFNDVENMKNYSDSMLNSMSNGVITLDEKSKIVTCNSAVLSLLKIRSEDIIGYAVGDFFDGPNLWVKEKIHHLEQTQSQDLIMDVELQFDHATLSVNMTLLPLHSVTGGHIGSMILLEDISNEKRMKATMSRYMDPGLTDQLLADDNELLGGHSANVTVLFSDIRGFTTLTEELGAQGTVSLLNDYFTRMVDCIHNEGGMLDKFIGDAIMAAFGTPIAHDDDEDRALRAGIEMTRSVWQWNEERAARGDKPIDMGLGLNTDEVVCGNIGSPKRMDYTIIGDGVNLAARLESACKQYAARILISEYTHAKLRGTYRMRDIDDVVVKGKTQSVRVYEVLDFHSAESFPNLMDVMGYFHEGRTHYQTGAWSNAIRSFNDALKAHPNDKLSQIYIDRCHHLLAHPPEKEWDGVWIMSSK